MTKIWRYQSVDIGSTKTSSTIVEVDENGEISVLSHAVVPSRGLRNSLVVNVEQTKSSIVEVVSLAQRKAGIQLQDVIVGIAGEHVRYFTNSGVVSIARDAGSPDKPGIVTENDIARVQDDARSISISQNQRILHVINQEYKVDDKERIFDPLNQSCRRLEVNVLIISALETALRDIERCVTQAGLRVRSLALESLASSKAVLTDDEINNGCMLIDIGGGTLDIGIFHEGAIRSISEIRYAGEIITSDIVRMFNIPEKNAEKAKVEYGSVTIPEKSASRKIPVQLDGYNDDRYIDEIDLNTVIRARSEEVVKMVMARKIKMERSENIASIVLTGGGSQLNGLVELYAEVFNLPTRLGIPIGFKDLDKVSGSPSSSTGLGLIKYQIDKDHINIPELSEGATITGIGKGFKNFFKWLFSGTD